MVITRSVLKSGFLRTVFKGMSGNLSGPAPDHVEGGRVKNKVDFWAHLYKGS